MSLVFSTEITHEPTEVFNPGEVLVPVKQVNLLDECFLADV